MDQAASLRQWATQQLDAANHQQTASIETIRPYQLMVIGMSGSSSKHVELVNQRLQEWSSQGHKWLGDVRRWQCQPVSTLDFRLSALASEHSRWALWVGSDLDAFQRSYQSLKESAANGGPKRLLALHKAGMSKKGLLSNLQGIAASNFGIELLVLTR